MTRPVVLVSGMVSGVPGQAGASWSVIQWVLGLRQLGYRAVLVEELAAGSGDVPLAATCNARYFLELVRWFGLEGDACLTRPASGEVVGMTPAALTATARKADCLLNLSGTLKDPRLLEAPAVRVYVDVDPGFTQLWELEGHDLGLEHHNRFVTLGLALGDTECPVATGGRRWIRTLPPVALSWWPPAEGAPELPFTTVVNWRGYGSVTCGGTFYGQKVHSFRNLYALPAVTGEDFCVASAISCEEAADLAGLARGGWQLVDPAAAAGTPQAYRAFVQRSAAELNVAKSGYVRTRCGWFSDRSACYLASGRPVVAQDTGLGEAVPSGEGLLLFSDLDSAAEAVAEVNRDYARQRKAARAFAENLLDARRVTGAVLEQVLA